MDTLTDIWMDLAGRVRRFVGRRVADAHAADDITQDVMLRVQAQLGALPEGEKLAAWVIAVARNAVIDHYRARAVRDHADVAAAEPVAEEPESDADAARELTPCLANMVRQLPEPYRTALRLVHLEGLSLQELADREGLSLSGAKSRVQRARRQLGEMLHDCCRIERDGRGNVLDVERTERSGRYCEGDAGGPDCGR